MGWREQQSQSVEEAQGDVDNPGSLGSCRQATNGKLGGNRSTVTSHGWKVGEEERTRMFNGGKTQPELGGVAYGVADRMDRLKAIGNGQVSEVARRAWELLSV
jgi:hypothetical protein